MGKHILAGLLGGILVMGFSTVYAEGPQFSEQELIMPDMAGQQLSDATTSEQNHGPQLLTDEELAQITGAGFGQLELGKAGEIIHFGLRVSKFVVGKTFMKFNMGNETP